MTAATMERTRDQRLAALQHANRIRTYRANLKQQLRARTVEAVELLADPPEELLSMKVYDLLMAQPGWGTTRVRRLMLNARISAAKTVGGLSDRQRRELIGLLR